MTIPVVAYLRVSTKSQGEHGLGIDAQREYIQAACAAKGWSLLGEYFEVASGALSPFERPQCKKAIEAAQQAGAILMVAKLDRLSRDVEHIAGLMKSIPLKVATMLEADALQLHIYAALAQQEREFIRQRTKEALQALKRRSERGDPEAQAKIARRDAGRVIAHQKGAAFKATQARIQIAEHFALGVAQQLKAAIFDGHQTLEAQAQYLNQRGVRTARGCDWTPTAVARVRKRVNLANTPY